MSPRPPAAPAPCALFSIPHTIRFRIALFFLLFAVIGGRILTMIEKGQVLRPLTTSTPEPASLSSPASSEPSYRLFPSSFASTTSPGSWSLTFLYRFRPLCLRFFPPPLSLQNPCLHPSFPFTAFHHAQLPWFLIQSSMAHTYGLVLFTVSPVSPPSSFSAALAKDLAWLTTSATCGFLPSLVEVKASDLDLLVPMITRLSRDSLMPSRSD